jgi:hypothetical protein
MTSAYLELTDNHDIGAFKAAAGTPGQRAWFRWTSAFEMGEFAAVGHLLQKAHIDLPDPFLIGKFRAVAINGSDPWAAQGFPPPHLESYRYSGGPYLIRTGMESGVVRQRRSWNDRYREGTVSFTILREQLGGVEKFLDEYGYDWFNMGLVTGDNAETDLVPHSVRVKANPAFAEVFGDTIKMTLTLDIRDNTAAPSADGTLHVVRVVLSGGALAVVGRATTLNGDLCGTRNGILASRAATDCLFTVARVSKNAASGYELLDVSDPALAGLAFQTTSAGITLATGHQSSGSLMVPVAALSGPETCSANSLSWFPVSNGIDVTATITGGKVEPATVSLSSNVVTGTATTGGVLAIFYNSGGLDPMLYGFNDGEDIDLAVLLVGGGGGGHATLGGGSGGEMISFTDHGVLGAIFARVGLAGGMGEDGGYSEINYAKIYSEAAFGGLSGSSSGATGGTGGTGTAPSGANGGAGGTSTITGTSVTYAGGGGGVGGTGGAGGGGNAGVAGTNGLGGGGGVGKAGGRGVVIFKLTRRP